ncbi:hypothetical protein ABE073_00290 [Lederbergia citrisecunda]|uniref:hypothetical protein n=1 Tax=Lederbergia citrisecunda TaxID=2833583 RepID=UPI003D2CAAD5
MTKFYRFKRLIEKYSVAFTVQKSTDGYYDEDTGDYIEGKEDSVPMKGAISPAKSEQIYNSGGRLTAEDCYLYILEPLEYKTLILYKGKTYSVEAAEDYSDYTDFYHYTLKAVSNFAGTK